MYGFQFLWWSSAPSECCFLVYFCAYLSHKLCWGTLLFLFLFLFSLTFFAYVFWSHFRTRPSFLLKCSDVMASNVGEASLGHSGDVNAPFSSKCHRMSYKEYLRNPSIPVPRTTIINKSQRQQASHVPIPVLEPLSQPSPAETNDVSENSWSNLRIYTCA